ncbi:hypothetical protein H8S95_17580 [Pontibacter sp. KCTC 32443]|uniref:hypothetical protein n=1 Tax=Pontibacter TaxID=323449 RepID=UPI00164D157D|nr:MULTISPECIES: hypothetical protein [Pontibacter]MBC5775890.1 hypothetical protein [Pontibacter sp. KCTC 32443]
MRILNTLFNIVAVAYALTLALVLTSIVSESAIFNHIRTEAQILQLYKAFAGVGAGMLLVKVILSSLYSGNLRYEHHISQLKVNDLKVELYERRQEFRNNNFRTPITEEHLEAAAV